VTTSIFLKRAAAIGLAALAILALAWSGSGSAPVAQDNNHVIELAPPGFLLTAHAEGDAVASFLETEAGISVYFKAPTTIDLNLARKKYRTIEVQNGDYIIGSVPVGNNLESEDVHVYTNRNGWMVAYYLAPDVAAKIIDWRLYDESKQTKFTTTLENALSAVALEAGITYKEGSGTYYDFRYPNANRLMVIGEWGDNESFQVFLPDTLSFYERSWSTGSTDGMTLKIDDRVIFEGQNRGSWFTASGPLGVTELPLGQYRTIALRIKNYWDGKPYGGIGLVYRVP
jgi:hypothetical protein